MKQTTKQKIITPILSVSPYLLYILLSLIFALALVLIFKLQQLAGKTITDEMLDNNIFVLLANPLALGGGAGLGCLFVKLYKKTSLKEVVWIKDFDIMVPLMLLLFSWGATELFDHFSGLVFSRFMEVAPNRTYPLTLYDIICTVICAPVFEELIFRYAGVEFPRGVYKMPTICIANGIFFAVAHFYNIQGFLNIFIGGIITAYVYYKTRNILYTILEHAVHNALCFLPLDQVSLFGTPLYYEKNGFVLSAWWWLIFNVALVGISVVWYIKVFRKKYAN